MASGYSFTWASWWYEYACACMSCASAQTMHMCLMRVQLRRTWHMLRSLGSLVFVVSKPRWPRHAVIPDLHLHRQRTLPTHLSELSISECVTIDYLWCHIWPIPMVCNDIPRDILERDPPRTYARTYVHTYFVGIDPQFRALH